MNKLSILYHGNVARLVDIVRQRIVFNDLQDVRTCVENIENDPELHIVKIDNRFDPHSDAHRTAGYRDVVLTLRVVNDTTNMLGISGHGCELQLAHREMVTLITPAQHDRYLKYKSVMHFGQGQLWRPDASWPCVTLPGVSVPQPSGNQVAPDNVPDNTPDNAPANIHLETGLPLESSSLTEYMDCEGLDSHIQALDEAGADLQQELTYRMFEVLRARCHLKGDMLNTMLNELSGAVKTADTSSVNLNAYVVKYN